MLTPNFYANNNLFSMSETLTKFIKVLENHAFLGGKGTNMLVLFL